MPLLLNILSIALLVIGFGFVIFWHELGHFLAAKSVGIKVEQFAVGMGHAILCWRKGIGLTVGTSADKFQARIQSEWEKRGGTPASTDAAPAGGKALLEGPDGEATRVLAKNLGLGETEYRLNWIPLGGYVKMLGQDDLDPAAAVSDPRAYNNKPISARMFVVSAGVLMNILLAAVFFMILFTWGFKVAPPLIGSVAPGSPAQRAGILAGDRILSINGNTVADFNKLQLGIVLLPEGATVPVRLLRDGRELEFSVKPEKSVESGGILQLGLGPTPALRGLKDGLEGTRKSPEKSILTDLLALKSDELVVAINGAPIQPERRGQYDVPSSYSKLLAALDAADGKPLPVTVENPDGTNRHEILIRPTLGRAFGGAELDIAGIQSRPVISNISEESSAFGKLLPGDVIVSIEFDKTRDLVRIDSGKKLADTLGSAASSGQGFSLNVERAGQTINIPSISTNVKLGGGRYGIGIGYLPDSASPLIASVVPGTPASRAGLAEGSRIVSVDGKPVLNLFEFRRALLNAGPNPVSIIAADAGGGQSSHTLQLDAAEVAKLAGIVPSILLPFDERIEPRKTDSVLTAMKWGVAETRDLVIQGYVTLKRIAERSVPASNMNGPVGIFHIGGKIATERSADWTLWFLAMISANLAVVNFLPIPIVDGGLFLFLLLEKLMGRPLSAKTQQIIQLAGLALICSVFLFVTYNDLARLFA